MMDDQASNGDPLLVPENSSDPKIEVFLHHGGNFVNEGWAKVAYEDGIVERVFNLDFRNLSMLDFMSVIAHQYTLSKMPRWLFYMDPMLDLFKELSSKKDFGDFGKLCLEGNLSEVHLYVEHNPQMDEPLDNLTYENIDVEMNAWGEDVEFGSGRTVNGEEYDVEEAEEFTSAHMTGKKSSGRRSSSASKHFRKNYKTKRRFKERTAEEVADLFRDIKKGSAAGDSSATAGGDVVEPESEGYTTEELRSTNESDENDDGDIRYPIFNQVDNMNIIITLGMEFENLEVFKSAVRDLNISLGREVDFVKNDKERVRAECVDKKVKKIMCHWVIMCSLNKSTHTFQVKTYVDDHTCCRRSNNRLASREWVAGKVVPMLRTQPNLTGSMIFEIIKEEHNLLLNDAMSYRALVLAHQICEGEEKAQYKRLRDYAMELLRCNPTSSVFIQSASETHEFERIYICLQPCKVGFKEGCRPLIGLDGCFLKGYYGGQLLSAVGQDGNNAFYVIAYAIVEVENKESWTWFVTQLLEDLDDPHGRRYTFISDMQKGLEVALRDVCPAAPHRFCCRHIWANFSKRWKGLEFRKAFWACAKATTPQHFQQAMEVVQRLSPDAAEYLNRIPPEKWSRSAFDTQCKNHSLTSNMCEQFNAEIVKVRGKPIITLLEGVRAYLTKKMVRSKGLVEKYRGTICPKVQKKLDEFKEKARFWTPHWSGDPDDALFEVTCPPHSKCAVDLAGRTCSCRYWDISGVPCHHAIACMGHNKYRAEEYVLPWFTKENSEKIYSNYINPTPGEDSWEKVNLDEVQPPNFKRKPGRPKMKRRKAQEEMSSNPHRMKRKLGPPKCGRCGQVGHNMRSCRGPAVDGETSAAMEGPSIEAEELNFSGSSEPPRATQPSQPHPIACPPPNFHQPPVRAQFRTPIGPPLSRQTMSGASRGTSKRFAAFFDPMPPTS